MLCMCRCVILSKNLQVENKNYGLWKSTSVETRHQPSLGLQPGHTYYRNHPPAEPVTYSGPTPDQGSQGGSRSAPPNVPECQGRRVGRSLQGSPLQSACYRPPHRRDRLRLHVAPSCAAPQLPGSRQCCTPLPLVSSPPSPSERAIFHCDLSVAHAARFWLLGFGVRCDVVFTTVLKC